MSDAEEVAFREMFSLVLAALVGLAILFLVIALIIAGGNSQKYVPAGMTEEEALAERIAPVGKVNMDGPQVAEADEDAAGGGEEGAGDDSLETAAQVYDEVCAACHAEGVAGAPATDATDTWEERVADDGVDTLYDHAINGFNAMPPRGGNSALSDEQVQSAVDYILDEAGVER